MASPAAYSRLVRILKIALPLAALAILSVLFIVAEELDPEAAIPYADVDVEQILRDQGVTNPSFGGVTEGGDVVALNADSLKRDSEDGDAMSARILSGAIELASGGRVDIESPLGEVDSKARTARLSGGVRVTETGGYVMTTDALDLNWDTGLMESGPVEAEGPVGTLTAGRMELTRKENGHVLVFDGGVRLLYDPEGRREGDGK